MAQNEPHNYLEDHQKVSGDWNYPITGRLRPKTDCSYQGEAATQLSLKLQELAAAAGVGKSTMHQLLREDLGVKPFKMLCQQELSDHHVAMKAEKCRKLLQDIAEGMLPNLVFTDEKKFNIRQAVDQKNNRVWASSSTTEARIVTRRQNPQSVMVWTAVTATGRSLLLFVPMGVKLNSERYISDILKGCLLTWAKQHFKDEPWTLQQDSAPSHGSKFTQSWILKKIPSFISKEDWPARSPDLNPLDYSIWSILEKRVCSTPHQTLESLKAKLMKEWDAIPQETLRAACNSFPDILKVIVKNKGSYIE